MSWVNRIWNLFRRNQVDLELEEELQFHLDARTRDNLSSGMNAVAAQHDARRRFGNATLAKERAHEMNIVVSIETIGRDLRYALRGLRKSPGFSVVAILTLALGIGANTAVFSVVDAALLRPLPYRNADRLVMIAQRLPKEPAPIFDTYREFEEWDRSSNSFETMAAATWAARLQTILSWHGEKKEVFAVPVSVNFFSMLGVGAAHGRIFAAEDLTGACTVVLAYPFWQKRLGSTPDWIGKSLTLDLRHRSDTLSLILERLPDCLWRNRLHRIQALNCLSYGVLQRFCASHEAHVEASAESGWTAKRVETRPVEDGRTAPNGYRPLHPQPSGSDHRA